MEQERAGFWWPAVPPAGAGSLFSPKERIVVWRRLSKHLRNKEIRVHLRVIDTFKSLCSSCRSSHIFQDAKGIRVICNASHMSDPVYIRGRVDDCNRFEERSVRSEYDYEKQAILITVDDKTGEIGFVRPGTEKHKKMID